MLHLGLGALITGCSSGIGRATAAILATAGYQVVATARQPAILDGLDVTTALKLDVTDASSIHRYRGASSGAALRADRRARQQRRLRLARSGRRLRNMPAGRFELPRPVGGLHRCG